MVGIVRVIFYIFLFLVVVLPISLIVLLVLKGKKQSWTGEIINKKVNEKRDFDTDRLETHYIVTIKKDNDKQINLEVDPSRYNLWSIGDKLEKTKGKLWPEKV